MRRSVLVASGYQYMVDVTGGRVFALPSGKCMGRYVGAVTEEFLIAELHHGGTTPKSRMKFLTRPKAECEIWRAQGYVTIQSPKVGDAIIYAKDLTPEQIIATPEGWQEYIILPPVVQVIR